MSRLLRLLATAAGALLLAVLADARPALAHHEWYTPGGEYRSYTVGGVLTTAAHDKSGVVKKWREGTGPLKWNSTTVDVGSGPLDTAVRPTIAYLQSMSGGEFSGLAWQEVASNQSPDVEFDWTANLIGVCGTDTACAAIYHAASQSPEGARYIATSPPTVEVFLNMGLVYSSNGMRASVMHELLHVMGLSEDYSEDPFNPSPGSGNSMMGASISGPGSIYGGGAYTCPGGPLVSCTQGSYANSFTQVHIVPTARDLDRLRAFWWGQEPSGHSGSPHWNGRYTDWGFQNLGSLILRVWSYDRAWSENWVVLDLYKETSPGVGTVVERRFVTANIGKHQYYSQAAYFQDFDLAGSGSGNYAVCGLPGYSVLKPATDGSGAWTCTPGYTFIN